MLGIHSLPDARRERTSHVQSCPQSEHSVLYFALGNYPNKINRSYNKFVRILIIDHFIVHDEISAIIVIPGQCEYAHRTPPPNSPRLGRHLA